MTVQSCSGIERGQAYKNEVYLFLKQPAALQVRLLSCWQASCGVYDVVSEKREVEVASPSCKRVASKSAGYDCVNNATVPQGRLRHQRASFRRVRLRQQRHRSAGSTA